MIEDLEIRKKKANEEWRKAIDWAIAEEDKVYEKLKSEGKLKPGLDGNSEDFRYIYEKLQHLTREIIHKYDLPNKVNWA